MFCVNCGHTVGVGASFCTKCGKEVSASSSPSEQSIGAKKSLQAEHDTVTSKEIVDVTDTSIGLMESKYHIKTLPFVIFWLMWMLGTGYYFFLGPGAPDTFTVYRGVYFAIGVMLLPILLYGFLLRFLEKRVQKTFMGQFAKRHGYQFTPAGELDDSKNLLLNVGKNQQMSNVVSGSTEGRPFRLYNFRLSTESFGSFTSSGKDWHDFTVFEVETKDSFPHIFLDADNIFDGKESLLQFKKKNFVSLEGDFSKYFKLYAPKQYETETLQIFTPDVMKWLIEKAQVFNLEFNGNRLYIYVYGVVEKKNVLNEMVELSRLLLKKFKPVLSKFEYEQIGDYKPELDARRANEIPKWVFYYGIGLFVALILFLVGSTIASG